MIEKLFTSKSRIRILEYLFFHNKETYLREIVKKLKISPSAVKRELDNLIEVGLVNKNNNRITLNESCPILNDLRNILLKTDFLVHPIKKIVSDKSIKFALIFGSFARGEYKSESDIDLMIIGNVSASSLYKKIDLIESQIERDINPVILTIKSLREQKQAGFIRDVFAKKIIMIKGSENELRKIIQ